MDEERRIRFLVSPTLFFASLLLGAWLDPGWQSILRTQFKTISNGNALNNVIGIVAGGSFLLFVAGYIIGTITHSFLRLFWYVSRYMQGTTSHEVALSAEDFSSILQVFHIHGRWSQPHATLYAGAAFDHGILRKEYLGVHQWLVRRWNAFSIGVTSVTGLILSLFVGTCFLHICFSPAWWMPVIFFAAVVAVTTSFAWHDVMAMLSLMTAVVTNRPKGGN